MNGCVHSAPASSESKAERADRAGRGLADPERDRPACCRREVVGACETCPEPVAAAVEREHPRRDAGTARARDREAAPGVTVKGLEDELSPAPEHALARRCEDAQEADLLAPEKGRAQVELAGPIGQRDREGRRRGPPPPTPRGPGGSR